MKHIKAKLSDPNANNIKTLHKTVKMLVDNQEKTNCKMDNNLQGEFAKFIFDKIETIHTQFDSSCLYKPSIRNYTFLKEFHEITKDQLKE